MFIHTSCPLTLHGFEGASHSFLSERKGEKQYLFNYDTFGFPSHENPYVFLELPVIGTKNTPSNLDE